MVLKTFFLDVMLFGTIYPSIPTQPTYIMLFSTGKKPGYDDLSYSKGIHQCCVSSVHDLYTFISLLLINISSLNLFLTGL